MTAPAGPPRLARWLVEHTVPRDVREDVAGDLIELFHRDTAAYGAARAAARYWRHAVSCSLRFGAERCRDALRGGMAAMVPSGNEANRPLRVLVGWRMDLRLAVRMAIRYPALTAIAVFGISVAIGVAVTILTIVGEQLSPSGLPLPGGDRIVALQMWDSAGNQPVPLVVQDVVAWREQLSMVRDVGAFRTPTRNILLPPAVPEPIEIAEMSAAGFDVAGIAPAMGRVLRAEDERSGAPPVVVIGHAEWHKRFGARPDVLGTSVQLGDTSYTVVGVMPEGFAFPLHHAYWTPLRLDASGHQLSGGSPLTAFGRLAPGATLQSAQAELTALGDSPRIARPKTDQDLRPRAVPYAYQFAEMDHPGNTLALQLLRFFIAVVLVVICINIAVLVYARTAARQAEIAVRTALGASRGRIVAQLFAEGIVLAGLGALAGVMGAAVALVYIREAFAQTEPLPFWLRFDLSGQTIVYAVALTVLAAAVIGALPAWQATGPRFQRQLRALTSGGGAGMHLGRLWTALIVLQVACAVALLPFIVGRMAELARDGTAQFGFAAHEYVLAQLSLEPTAAAPHGAAETASRFALRVREIEQRIAASGPVRATTFSSFAPGFEAVASIRSDIVRTDANVRVNRVSVNFFETFRVPLLTGRHFVTADAAPEAKVVLVNRSFARVAPEGVEVLGSRIRPAGGAHGDEAVTALADDWYEIVGIVEDFPAPASGDETAAPKVYTAITPEATDALTITLHLDAADTESWGTRLRRMAADVDPTLRVMNVTSMDDLLRRDQRSMRLLAAVCGAMTLSVLVLSAAGIYAMMAFSVTQRRREIGIRLALGAGSRRILWALFSRAAAQLLTGAALGTGVALLLDRAAEGGMIPGDAAGLTAGVVLLMVVVGLLAALGPARQGLKIAPTEALRDPTR